MARSPHTTSSKHQIDDNRKKSIRILDLPLEIQCENFNHAHCDNSNSEVSCLPVEVVLSHVCSEWRNLAINLPTLWTAFKFDTHLRVSDPAKKLEKYLYRSRKRLLELYFSFSSFDYEEYPDQYTLYELYTDDFSLVETAIDHAYRWRRFTFFADHLVPTLYFIHRFHKIHVPNLEYLAMCLSTYSHSAYHGNINPLILTGGAPRLYTIRIDTTTIFHSLPPLSNITTLAIQDKLDGPYVGFQFHVFHSILSIPTLTNLSIETWNCLDYEWIVDPVDPGNIPRFKMPSLKTLRITEDSHILGMLSLLDAPLLETLVLHDVDLTSVIIGQHIHEITTFIRLDTIAFLSCQSRFGWNQETVDRADMILNTLACRATHIIISCHDGPSFIEKDSNLLQSIYVA